MVARPRHTESWRVVPAATADRREDAFTLIELMVVILIIAILMAIAIPTFLGARQRAQDRAAESDLRNSLTAAETAYANKGDYATAQYSDMNVELSPNLFFSPSTTPSSGPKHISVDTPPAADPAPQQWSGAELSASGTCFSITVVKIGVGSANQTPGVFYSQVPGGAATCDGAHADAATATAFS